MTARTLIAVALAAFLACLPACQSAGYPASEAYAPSEDGALGFVDKSWGEASDVSTLGRSLDEGDAALAAPPGSPEAPGTQRADPGVARQVIYSARLALVVVSIVDTQAQVLAVARELGGHLQQRDARSITVRVPAARFDEALALVARFGEVVDQAVSASDVTEELFDLDIRIDNARQARERLLAHLAASQKVEDTLKIEAELTRLTEELERMEGRKRFLASQVALSTIRVELNSTSPAGPVSSLPVIPFDWVTRLGDGLLAGAVEAQPRAPRFLASGPAFDLPPSFLRYYQSKELVEAMDADGVRIKVQRHDNHDEGALEFWQKLARRALVEGRALAVSEERALGSDRALVVGTRDVGGVLHGFMLVLVRTPKRVVTFEAWGPTARFEQMRSALEASAASLRL